MTSITEKTYTTKTSSSRSMSGGGGGGGSDDRGRHSHSIYHSTITPRTSLLTQSAMMAPGSRSYSYKSEYSHGGVNEAPIRSSVATNSEVQVVKSTRQNEKKEMRDLNERLASYIEKVRFLEAQNGKLANELEDLRNKWGKETASIREMYETELKEARKVLDDQAKEKAEVEVREKSLEEQNRDVLKKLDEANLYHNVDSDAIKKLNAQLAEYDGEISLLRRNLEQMEKERDRDKKTIVKLNDEVERLRNALNNMTLAQLDAENRRQTLQEEIEFLKNVHEEEMKELAALAYRDTTEENREFWTSELSSAVKDIQNEFDMKSENIRSDLEAYYNLKVQEFKTSYTKQNMETTHAREETKKLRQQLSDLKNKVADLESRNAQLEQQYLKLQRDYDELIREHMIETGSLKEEITSLRAEMDKVLQELQTLMDAKLSLELEISAYRKLLELEENRVGIRSVVEDMISSQTMQQDTQYVDIDPNDFSYLSSNKISQQSDGQMAMKVMRGELSARTTSQRTVKGPIAISDISSEGKYITLENKGTSSSVTDVALDGWQIVRKLDGKKDVTYKFGSFTLPANKTVTVYAQGSAKLATSKDLVMSSSESWGVGSQVVTTLLNDKGQEKASTVQNTVYQ